MCIHSRQLRFRVTDCLKHPDSWAIDDWLRWLPWSLDDRVKKYKNKSLLLGFGQLFDYLKKTSRTFFNVYRFIFIYFFEDLQDNLFHFSGEKALETIHLSLDNVCIVWGTRCKSKISIWVFNFKSQNLKMFS